MTEHVDEDPKWVQEARAAVKQTKLNLNDIRKAGDADIKRGLETVRTTDKRLQELNYIDQLLDHGVSPNAWDDEIVRVNGLQLGGTIDFLQNDTRRLAGLYLQQDQKEQADHVRLNFSVNSTGTTSNSLIFLGAQIERRLQVISPPYRPVIDTENLEQVGSGQQIFIKLATLLGQFDQSFLNMLNGSEDALHHGSADSLSQAAHSMRDLFEQIIKHLAPGDVVKQQPWFEKTVSANEGVSRRSRLRYILYGSGESFDEWEIRRLDEAAEGAKNALDLAIARAHNHDPELVPAEVEGSIDHARFSLLQVLKQYELRRGQDVT